MIKIEMHAHSKGGSGCASVPAETLIKEYKEAGYGGIVLTNHMCESEFAKYPGATKNEKIDYYMSLYEEVKSEGEKQGLKVFLGMEVRAKQDSFIEFMIYGFDKEFLYNNPPLYTLTQKELFELCNKNGVLMYQTHPYRNGVALGDPKYIHGAEYFNGHVNHINNNGMAMEFCDKHNLIKLCGTDFHDAGQPITSYALIPDDINDAKELTKYIFEKGIEIHGDEEKYRQLCRKK